MGKFLDKSGVEKLWGKTKSLVSDEIGKIDVSGDIAKAIKDSVTDKLGAANGIATLGSDSKLTASQLPALKTVNGESIVGSGNISIDLNIYQIVDALPESNQNPNKIYLVLTSPATGQEQDVYTEYLWTGTKWEKLGEYKAEVDLTGYVKKQSLEQEIKSLNKFVTLSDTQFITNKTIQSPKITGSNGISFYDSSYSSVEDLEGEDRSGYMKISSDTITLGSVTDEDEGTGFNLKIRNNSVVLTDSTTSDSNKVYNLLNDKNWNNYITIPESTKDEAISSEELDEILV